MNLFEAIVEANHRAVGGDSSASLARGEFAAWLPIVALTCIDARLNPLLPAVLGLKGEDFIWLRNAGNIVTGPLSSTMRSLALACALKGGKEIVVIGHTDCRVRQTTVLELTERFRALGVERARLPDNLNEYFGLFASERQNVVKAVDFIRQSPLIGAAIPVHGLLVDIQTGQLNWVVNGYQTLAATPQLPESKTPGLAVGAASARAAFSLGELKFPAFKIGEGVAAVQELSHASAPEVGEPPPPPAPPPPPPPPKLGPLPRPVRPVPQLKKWRVSRPRP